MHRGSGGGGGGGDGVGLGVGGAPAAALLEELRPPAPAYRHARGRLQLQQSTVGRGTAGRIDRAKQRQHAA